MNICTYIFDISIFVCWDSEARFPCPCRHGFKHFVAVTEDLTGLQGCVPCTWATLEFGIRRTIGSKLLLSCAAWPGQLKSAWTPGYLDTGFLGKFFSTPQHPPDMSLFGSTLAGGFCWRPEFGNRLMCFMRFMDIHGRTSNKRRIRKVEFTLAEVVSKDPKGYFESWT